MHGNGHQKCSAKVVRTQVAQQGNAQPGLSDKVGKLIHSNHLLGSDFSRTDPSPLFCTGEAPITLKRRSAGKEENEQPHDSHEHTRSPLLLGGSLNASSRQQRLQA
eukprot:scaffold665779_cov45-Prasinocladus_malaysianus.AAC.2